eukprot:766976-Hanusia_phi.AAC.14
MGAEVSMCEHGCLEPVKTTRQGAKDLVAPVIDLRNTKDYDFQQKWKIADEREKMHLEEKMSSINEEIFECEKILSRVRGVSLSRSSESMEFEFVSTAFTHVRFSFSQQCNTKT